jgi:hypothetical protein
VPKRQEIGDSASKFRENVRKKLVGEGEEPSPSIFFSSLLEHPVELS